MSLRTALASLMTSVGPLAKPAVTTVVKVWQPDKPELAELIGQLFDLGEKALDDTGEWRAGLEEKLDTTRHDLTVAGDILEILATQTVDLLRRVVALESRPEAAEEFVELQLVEAPWAAAVAAVRTHADRLDSHRLRLDVLAAGQEEMRPLLERGVYAADLIAELKAEGLTPSLVRGLRQIRQAAAAIAENRPDEAVRIQQQLAADHPGSAAARVGLAAAQVADHNPLAADRSLKEAVRLRPNDDGLRKLSSRVTELNTRNTPARRPPNPVRRPKAGDTLDGWRLSALHGRGGMGQVFHATRRGGTGALKVMHPELSTDFDRREQFQREMMALMKLDPHPNLVGITHFGRCDDFGCWYFVMPLVEGPTLARHLNTNGPLPAGRALPLFRGLAAGLAKAHARGLIHRDIKPDNLILTPDERLVLVDFGLAAEAGVSGHTQAAGLSAITAAPETFRDNTADRRADVYSFAATLYLALVYADPKLHRPEKYKPDRVPAEFRHLLTACLQLDPDDRPAHAGEVLALFDPPPVPAPPVVPVVPVVPLVAVPPPPVVPVAKPVRKAGDKFALDLPGGVKMAFAWCPPGTFLMGSPPSEKERRSDEQQHEVRLTKGFYTGVHPVTQAEWNAVMGTDPSHFKGAALPVEQVNWDDAQAFCAKVRELTGKAVRLPTEAEWEYAARGGTTTPFYWGGELNGTQANCDGRTPYGTSTKGPYLEKTTPVGSYAEKFPHPWGLTDVHGNVWEWCQDWYDEKFYARSPKDDPECRDSEQKYRILRGGSWYFSPEYCRAAFRFRREPAFRNYIYGFRVVFCMD